MVYHFITFFLCFLAARIGLAQGYIDYVPPIDPVKRSEKCSPGNLENLDKFDRKFCRLFKKVKENSSPYSLEIFSNSAPVILLGETHSNITIKKWIVTQVEELKSLGFTHIGMEAINRDRQWMVDEYRNGGIEREKMVDLFREEWGERKYFPEAHVDFIEGIHRAGLGVVALENRIDRHWRRDRNLPRTDIDHDMASSILNWYDNRPPEGGRMIALVGSIHAKTAFVPGNRRTITQHLKENDLDSVSYHLDSDSNKKNTNPLRISFVGAQKESASFLPLDRNEDFVDGVIFVIDEEVEGFWQNLQTKVGR